MAAKNPADRRQIASIAALARWKGESPTENAIRGQAGLRARFLREVDERAAGKGEELTDAERDRRADCAYREHMKRVRRVRTVRRAPSTPDGGVADG